ncbi:hypothetical protein Hamer_G017141, partial [Homarus americanus]
LPVLEEKPSVLEESLLALQRFPVLEKTLPLLKKRLQVLEKLSVLEWLLCWRRSLRVLEARKPVLEKTLPSLDRSPVLEKTLLPVVEERSLVLKMVELGGGGPDGPIEHGFSNSVFIVAAAVLLPLVVFFAVKLVRTFWQRERRRHEKRKLKLERHKKK